MPIDALLADLAIVFLAGMLAVLGLGRIGLPPVVGFILAGLLIGPRTLGWIDDAHSIELVAELGVALLLFTIGMEFSFDRLARIGRFVALGGSLQVGLTIAAALLAAWMMGASVTEGIFWGYLAAVSSTAIVLRLLTDRGELDAPHGRIVVGVLIFQDLSIVPMMLTVPLLAGHGTSGAELAWVLGKAVLVVVGVVVAARLVVPSLLHFAAKARSREVFVLTVLCVATGVAWATSSIGMSIALGAFLAGVTVADTEFVHQVLTEVSPLRDALASLFFVSIGMLLDPTLLISRPLQVGGLVVLLVVGKLLVAVLAILLLRLPARVALLSGLALAQVGEFSFVLLQSGSAVGLVDDTSAATFLAASVVTMIAAPVIVAMSPRLAAGAALLRPLERLLVIRGQDDAAWHEPPLRDHIVVAGMGLGGRTLVRSLEAAGVPYVALELNPETVIAEREVGRTIRYGDATSLEVLEQVACISDARQLVLLLSDVDAGRRAAAQVRAHHPDVPILLRVHRLERDAHRVDLPNVHVVAEDHEAAVEVVERVLRNTGVAGELIASAVSAARSVRDDAGLHRVHPAEVAGTLHMQAVHLARGDWAAGRTLAALDLRATSGALIVATAREGHVHVSPRPLETLCAGDTLFLVGTDDQIAEAVLHLAEGPSAQPVGDEPGEQRVEPGP